MVWYFGTGIYLIAEHVRKQLSCQTIAMPGQTKVINLENKIRRTIMPLKELQRTPEFTRKHNTKINLDSARFWETFAASACSLFGSSAYFDSMTFFYPKKI
jgi:threonine aldolase